MEVWHELDLSFAEEHIEARFTESERDVLARAWLHVRENGQVRLCLGEDGDQLFKVDFFDPIGITKESFMTGNPKEDVDILGKTFTKVVHGEADDDEIETFFRQVGLMLIQLWKMTAAFSLKK